MAVLNVFIFVLMVGAVFKTRGQTIKNGLDILVGAEGRTLEFINLQGQAVIRGEIWNVQAKTPIAMDKNIRVLGAKGLILEVEEE
jgi:membrane-bound serine protease (ClpP class)